MRSKIREVWMCVSDDGSGDGEGVISQIHILSPERARRIGIPESLAGFGVSVLMMAYDRPTFDFFVLQARAMGKPFRVLHFDLPVDRTAEF